MQTLYPYILVVHLLCAIIFIGYLFTDVILLAHLKKVFGDKLSNRIFASISKRGIKIMPFCVLILIITGGIMISHYIGGEKGYFNSSLQILLIMKMCFALCIALMVGISLSCKFLGLKNPLSKIIHPIALILGFIIVVLAKIAFIV